MVDMSLWKELFFPDSSGVKHVTAAIVQPLKNNPDSQSHLYGMPTATGTQRRARGLLPLHHTLYWGG